MAEDTSGDPTQVVMAALREADVNVLNKGSSGEQECDDGIYETHWWEIAPEDADTLRDHLAGHDDISMGMKNPSRGPDMDDTVRISARTCIIPVPPEEHAAHIDEQYEEERAEYYRKKYEQDNGSP